MHGKNLLTLNKNPLEHWICIVHEKFSCVNPFQRSGMRTRFLGSGTGKGIEGKEEGKSAENPHLLRKCEGKP